MRMAEFVTLERIINFLNQIGQQNTYSEFKPTFEEKVKTETYHENILDNAQGLIQKDIMAASMLLDSYRSQGCVANKLKCDHCDMFFTNRWDK